MRRTSSHIPWPWWVPAVLTVLAGLVLLPPAASGQMGSSSDVVRDYIERTDELLVWAREMVAETESGTARNVLRQAAHMNREAANMHSMGNDRHAGNIARRARAAVWHAVKLAREAMGLQERLRVRAERFRELHRNLTERAQDAGHEGALGLMHEAERQAHRAREQHLQGDLRMSWQMFERAEDLMAMAARLLVQTGDPDMLERELERMEDLIDQARQRLGPDLSEQSRRDLNEADEALVRARRRQGSGEPGRALQMVGLARRMVERSLDNAGGGQNQGEAVDRQIARFDERLDRVRSRLEDSDSERARQLVGQARDYRDRANTANDRGEHEEALRQIRAAHDLLEQAERMLR